jgi:hypothetical protein
MMHCARIWVHDATPHPPGSRDRWGDRSLSYLLRASGGAATIHDPSPEAGLIRELMLDNVNNATLSHICPGFFFSRRQPKSDHSSEPSKNPSHMNPRQWVTGGHKRTSMANVHCNPHPPSSWAKLPRKRRRLEPGFALLAEKSTRSACHKVILALLSAVKCPDAVRGLHLSTLREPRWFIGIVHCQARNQPSRSESRSSGVCERQQASASLHQPHVDSRQKRLSVRLRSVTDVCVYAYIPSGSDEVMGK